MLEVKESLHVVGIGEIHSERFVHMETLSLMDTLATWFRVREIEVSAIVSSGSSSGRSTARMVSRALGGVESFVFSYLERVLIEDFDACSWDRLDRWSSDRRTGAIDGKFDRLLNSQQPMENNVNFSLSEDGMRDARKAEDDLYLVFAALGFQVVLVVLPSKSIGRSNGEVGQDRLL